MMQLPNTGYLWQPTEAQWDTMLRDLPRANLEAALYDLTFTTGVLHGMEIAPSVNMVVTVTRGRCVRRNDTTRRGELSELFADLAVDLAPYRPSVGNQSAYIVAKRRIEPVGPTVLVENPANTHPDYDPLFTSYNLSPSERDECDVLVVTTLQPDHVVLAVVNLTAAQTAMPADRFNFSARADATNAKALAALRVAFDALKATVDALQPDGNSVARARTADSVDWEDVAGRPTDLGGAIYDSNQTPPFAARPGTIWVKGGLTLVKISNSGTNPALWRALTSYSFGIGFKDYLTNNENSYRDVGLPVTIEGLNVVRGLSNGLKVAPGVQGTLPGYISVHWRVPAGATLGTLGNPTAGTEVYTFAASGDNPSSNTIQGIQPILPGERIWIKLGMAGGGSPQGDVWCSAFANLSLELNQSAE
jgi:hypothetical protein